MLNFECNGLEIEYNDNQVIVKTDDSVKIIVNLSNEAFDGCTITGDFQNIKIDPEGIVDRTAPSPDDDDYEEDEDLGYQPVVVPVKENELSKALAAKVQPAAPQPAPVDGKPVINFR